MPRRPVSPGPSRAITTERPSSPLPPLGPDVAVDVVVPARDAAAGLRRAVASVLEQDLAPAAVAIAVGPSRDDTMAVARSLAAAHPDRVTIVDNPSGRTPDALNAAIAATSSPVVARVDAQAVLPPGYLERAVATLRETGAANVGGIQRPVATSGTARAIAAAMRSPAGSGGAAYRGGTSAGPVDTVYLGVFRRDALDLVGGFDPTFVRNQDAELNLRLRRAGFEVWLDPTLVVDYRPRPDLRALAVQYHGYGRWRRLTARRHPGSLALRQLAPPAVVIGLGSAALLGAARRDVRPPVLAAGGYLAAVTGAGALAADEPRDAVRVACALATMHLSWGIGFLPGPPRTRR